MNIAIFEPEHFEVVNAMIQVLNPLKNSITVLTSSRSYEQLQYTLKDGMKDCKWVVLKNNKKRYRFYRIYRETTNRKIDLLILNTINDNFIFYALLVKSLSNMRIILGVHDINSYFHFRPAPDIRTRIRNIGKKWLTNSIGEFNVISLGMADYLKTKIPVQKKVHCLPGGIYNESLVTKAAPSLQGEIILVVPGTIDGRRRNYELVFELLKEANEKKIRLSIMLLGSAYGKYGDNIIQKCRLYSATNNNLKFYESGLVDQAEFDRVAAMAHFIFIPCVIHTVIFDGIEETYGVSKCTGNLFDVVKHAKPFIIPNELEVDLYLRHSCMRYTNVDDILHELSKLQSSPEEYLLLHRKALAASANYTPENIRARNPGIYK